MASCAFFGHRSFNYSPYKEQIKNIIIDLIENYNVTEFYNGSRGNFDSLCAGILYELKGSYPDVKLIMVLSYHPNSNFFMPKYFDESVYLLEENVPPKYAVNRTNKCLVDLVDFIVSGVCYTFGGAYNAYSYAKRLNKSIIEIKYEQE